MRKIKRDTACVLVVIVLAGFVGYRYFVPQQARANQTAMVDTNMSFASAALAYGMQDTSKPAAAAVEQKASLPQKIIVAPSKGKRKLARKDPSIARASAEKPFDELTPKEKNDLAEKLGGQICPSIHERPVWVYQFMIDAWLGTIHSIPELKASIRSNCSEAVEAVKTGINTFAKKQSRL